MLRPRVLPKTVVVLGFVSLLNDAASEMITPLLPVFLVASLGAGPAVVGLVEGVAEATSSVLKLLSGRLADRGWRAKRLVLAGYGLSNTARPLIGLALGWAWVLALRVLDRAGKGIRTAPRDAMIAQSAPPSILGRAFGFHRGMDHAGAVVGPLLAAALLAAGAELREVFFYSIVPGLAVMLLLGLGLPARQAPQTVSGVPRLRWRALDHRLRALIIASGGLALATTPEVFLVLWAQDKGLTLAQVPLIWASASAVKALLAVPGGALSDAVGRLPVVTGGWCIRVALLLLLAFVDAHGATIWLLFVAYSGTLALTEAAEGSLIGEFAPRELRATAFGLYHLVNGIFLLPGAVLFGLLWQYFGSKVAFCASAVLVSLAAGALLFVAANRNNRDEP